MIPESYENEYSIWLILTAFEVFLVWVTFCRLTGLGMFLFCWDSRFRFPILIWFSKSARLLMWNKVITYFRLSIGICVFFERNTASCFRCCVFCQNEDGNPLVNTELSMLLEDHHIILCILWKQLKVFYPALNLFLVCCSLNDFVPITDPRLAFTVVCGFDSLVFEEFLCELH